MLKEIIQWMILGAFLLYISVKIKCRALWNVTIGAWLKRPKISHLGGRHYVVSFYIGETLCKIIVKRRGPPDFYAATSPYMREDGPDVQDISDIVAPFFTVQEISPTPATIGFETITFWDFEDNPLAFSDDNIITF
jgi:hypothetical protein